MSIGEIARCLYKKNWADNTEYEKALNAYKRLSASDQHKVEAMGARYG